MKEQMIKARNSLVGRWVLTPEDATGGPEAHQGYIAEELGMSYLVQWFSWLDGAPNGSQLFTKSQMSRYGWTFYDNEADWHSAGQMMVAK